LATVADAPDCAAFDVAQDDASDVSVGKAGASHDCFDLSQQVVGASTAAECLLNLGIGCLFVDRPIHGKSVFKALEQLHVTVSCRVLNQKLSKLRHDRLRSDRQGCKLETPFIELRSLESVRQPERPE
jgi:hypothetical protein